MEGCVSVCLIALLINLSLGVLIPANNPLISYEGRILADPGESSVQFDWSGVLISTTFNGTSISAVMADNGNFYNIFIDDDLVQVLNTTSNVDSYVLVSGINAGVHTLLMTKRTEAFFGIVTFSAFVLDDGANLLPSQYKSTRPIQVRQSSRRIEFVGDSITCGFGDMGQAPCNFSPATENNWDSWGPLVAEYFNAEYHLEAWSGKGVIRNCCNQNITTPDPLPVYWGRTLAGVENNDWNMSSWVPDALVINLGTNDYSTPPQPPQDLFQNAYISFVQTIAAGYSDDLTIFLACGPMIANPCCEYVQNVVAALNTTLNIHYIDLMNILTYPQDFGCDGHPNTKGHQIMASYSIPVIEKFMKW